MLNMGTGREWGGGGCLPCYFMQNKIYYMYAKNIYSMLYYAVYAMSMMCPYRLADGWIFVHGVEKVVQVVARETYVDEGK